MLSSTLERRVSLGSPHFLSAAHLRQDALLSSISQEAADPLSIVAMLGGSLAFKASQLFLGRLASPLLSQSSTFTRFFLQSGIRASALASEVAVFRGISSGPSNVFQSKEFARDFLGFGILKSVGATAPHQNPFLVHFLQSGGMVVGEHLAYQFGLTTSPQGNLFEQFAHAEAMNLKMGLGMSLAGLVAPGFSRMERNLELENRRVQPHETSLKNIREITLPRMATVEEVLDPRLEALDRFLNEFLSRYEGELEHLGSSDTPFRNLALETLRSIEDAGLMLQGERALEGMRRLDRLMDVLRDYPRRRHEISTTLVIENRKVLPQFRTLLDTLFREDSENRIMSTQSDTKDERKIPVKLVDRGWRSMGPFTDLIRGKIIVRRPDHARWVLDQLAKNCNNDCRIREIRNPQGKLTGVLDIEPFERILDGYIRGTEKFELRRIKVVLEIRDSEGVFHPVELQIMTQLFDRWGEIQRRLVKDNKKSSSAEWEILDDYCNTVARWIANIEQGGVMQHPPEFSQATYHSLSDDLMDAAYKMQALVEEIEHELREDVDLF